MPAKRNPFNENVNRLMEKIFSDKKPSRAPQKIYQEESFPKAEDGILHDTRRKNGTQRKKTGMDTSPKKAEPWEEADEAGFLNSSLQDIRRTTEKIRETTKQMQQMTLQMWMENAQAQGKNEKKGVYGEERIPPRPNQSEKASGQSPQNVWKKPKTAPQRKRYADEAAEWQQEAFGKRKNSAAVPSNAGRAPYSQPSTPPVRRTVPPQYRMEEVLDASVPERIRECKQFARSPQGMRMTKEELFFRQACMMEDYKDDCLYPGDFTWYFPSYQAMNAAQLRGYFTWRTQLRQGDITRAPLSFAFVYVYELLHQIGAKTPEEGFSLLKNFWENYREYDIQLDRYLQGWLRDYVVYYNLDRELLLSSQDAMFDEAMLAFVTHSQAHPQEEKDEEYFAAICALSRYNMEGSKFYKEYPKDVCRVTCGVFRALTIYYEKHGKKTLVEKYFGTMTKCSYQMFASAVFYDHKKYKEYEYVINPLHRYQCVNGRWSCEKYFGNRTKSKEMGLILHAIDARMRERYEYKSPLKSEDVAKLVMNIIEKEIDRLLEDKKKNAAPVIEIDVTKLSGIRRAAELTREKLIVEGSEEDADADDILPDMDVIPSDTDAGILTENEALQKLQNTDEEISQFFDTREPEHPAAPKAAKNTPIKAGKKQTTDTGQLEFTWEGELVAQDAAQETDTWETVTPKRNTPEANIPQTSPDMVGKTAHAQDTTLLNETEYTLLRFLLDGTPYQEFLRGRHQMLSVVADAINEKLFDRFGDTVIVFEGDTPMVLEDYVGEVEEILSEIQMTL